MYSTASSSPTFACSGGRYAIRMCLPTDGPAPALVTYERRPLRVDERRAVPRQDRLAAEHVALHAARRVWSSTVSVQSTAAGSRSRWATCASLPTKSSAFTFPQAMPASTTS